MTDGRAARPRAGATTRAWLGATRPKTLTAAVTPVLVGSAVAAQLGGFRAGPAAAAAAGAVFIQIGTNLVNDVADFERGADDAGRLGPARATQSGALSPASVKAGAAAAFALAAACGVYLVAVAGWPVAAIGVASIAAGAAYTAGPFPLAYNGLGDVFVFAFFGFVAVCGTAFVQLLRVPLEAALWSVPVGALATAILVVNNVRDVDSDRRAGKRTLQVLLGRRSGGLEFGLLIAAAYAVPPAAVLAGRAPLAVLATWLTAPLAARELRRVARATPGERLDGALGGTARLLFFYGAVLSVALVAGVRDAA